MKNRLKIAVLSCALLMMTPTLCANCKEYTSRPCRGFCTKPTKQALAQAKSKRGIKTKKSEPVKDETAQVMTPEEATTSITSSIRVLASDVS